MNEVWLPVSTNEGYEVSNLGAVRRTDSKELCGQWVTDQGYMLVRLSKPRTLARVHRLVCEAFVPNPNDKPYVNHIDCMRTNNAAANLEWCTQQENLMHSDRLGRMQKSYWKGRRSPNALLTDDQVRAIRATYAGGGLSWESVGRLYGISKRCAGRIIKNEVYSDVQ